MEQRLEIIKAISNFIFVNDILKKSDVIIVPGSSQLSLINKAVELYKRNYADKIIFTGGFNVKINKIESEYALEIAIKAGVPRNCIFVEKISTNTKENAIEAKRIVVNNKLDVKKIILVSKTYHSRRLKMTFCAEFGKQEIIVIPVIDDRKITKFNWWKNEDKKKIVLGEVQKIGEYSLKGDLLL